MRNTKIISYTPLHYGKEYLKYSILSYMDVVDKIVFLYTEKPSYGHNSHLRCPESEEELKDIVFSTTNKAEWVRINANNEGEHRHKIDRFRLDYDLGVATDYDEVWNTQELERALVEAKARNYARYGIDGFVNFWKDFNNACYDGFRPHRIFNYKGQGEAEIKATIYHFGYAISEEMMRYKWAIHGHHGELKKGWIDKVYLGTGKEDLHPVSNNLWNAQPFDKNTLPEFMKTHPLWSK